MKEDLFNHFREKNAIGKKLFCCSYRTFARAWKQEYGKNVYIPKKPRWVKSCPDCSEYRKNLAKAKTKADRDKVRDKQWEHRGLLSRERATWHERMLEARAHPEQDQDKTGVPVVNIMMLKGNLCLYA